MKFLALPFLYQGILMFIDEFYYHQKRGLKTWEKIGHPLDTLSVLFCFLFVLFIPYDSQSFKYYLFLSILSCIFVTKDEFVHAEECKPGEHWIHAQLFILHPIILGVTGYFWVSNINSNFLRLQASIVFAFLLFQIIYWNFKKTEVKKSHSVNNDIYELYGDRWYTAYDDPIALLRAESKAKLPWVLKILSQTYGKESFSNVRILDVGCGGGFLSNALAKEKLNVSAVDLSSESIQVAKAHDTTFSVHYQTADASNLPFEDHSFDVITAMDFLEHVEDPKNIIKECARVLKPGGLFIFHTFNRNLISWLVIIKFVEWFVKNTPKHMHVLKLFITPDELKEYCKLANLIPKDFIGIRPKFSTIPIKNIFTGIVPKELEFTLTHSLKLSYMGFAKKDSSPNQREILL